MRQQPQVTRGVSCRVLDVLPKVGRSTKQDVRLSETQAYLSLGNVQPDVLRSLRERNTATRRYTVRVHAKQVQAVLYVGNYEFYL